MLKIESGTQCPRIDFQEANKLHMKFTMLFTLRRKGVGRQRAEGTKKALDAADCYSQSKRRVGKQEVHQKASVLQEGDYTSKDRAET